MEKDYYGALLGGLLFAFFALPYLGLTYTPIALGVINFLVASLLLWRFFDLIGRKKLLVSSFVVSLGVLIALGVLSKPIILYGEQRQFRDKVIFTKQTPHQNGKTIIGFISTARSSSAPSMRRNTTSLWFIRV
jgi:spermidine synthase